MLKVVWGRLGSVEVAWCPFIPKDNDCKKKTLMAYIMKTGRAAFCSAINFQNAEEVTDNGKTYLIVRLAEVMEVALHRDALGLLYLRGADFTCYNPRFSIDPVIIAAAHKVIIGPREDRDPKDAVRIGIANFVGSWNDQKRTAKPGLQLLEAYRAEVMQPAAPMCVSSNTVGRGRVRTSGPFIALEILPYLLFRFGIESSPPDPRWQPVWDLIAQMERFPLISMPGPRACKELVKRSKVGREPAKPPVALPVEAQVLSPAIEPAVELDEDTQGYENYPDYRQMSTLTHNQLVNRYKYFFRRCQELQQADHSTRDVDLLAEMETLRNTNKMLKYRDKQNHDNMEKIAALQAQNKGLDGENESLKVLLAIREDGTVNLRKSGTPLIRKTFEEDLNDDERWTKLVLAYKLEGELRTRVAKREATIRDLQLQIERLGKALPPAGVSTQTDISLETEAAAVQVLNTCLQDERKITGELRERIEEISHDKTKAQYCPVLRGRHAEDKLRSVLAKTVPENVKIFDTRSYPHHADFTLIFYSALGEIEGYALIDCKHYQDAVPGSEVDKLERDVDTCRDRYGSQALWASIVSVESQISHKGQSRAGDYFHRDDIPIILVHGLAVCVEDDGSSALRDMLGRADMYLKRIQKTPLEPATVLRLRDLESRANSLTKPVRRSRSASSRGERRAVSIREPTVSESKDETESQEFCDDIIAKKEIFPPVQEPEISQRDELPPLVFRDSKTMTAEAYEIASCIYRLCVVEKGAYLKSAELIQKLGDSLNRGSKFLREHIKDSLVTEAQVRGRFANLRFR